MGGIFLVLKEFFLEGVCSPPLKFLHIRPWVESVGLPANFYRLFCNFLPSSRQLLGGAPPPGSAAPGMMTQINTLIT